MYNKYIDLYISGYKAGSRDVVINLHKSANSDVYELDYLNYLDSNSPILHDANFSSETILNKQANTVELLRLGGGSLAQGGKLLGKGLIQTGTGLGKRLASSIASGYSGLSNLLRYNPAYNSIKQRQVSNLVNNNPKNPRTIINRGVRVNSVYTPKNPLLKIMY